MDSIEGRYCRSPFAKLVNAQEDMVWQPQMNCSDSSQIRYISGRPDGEVLLQQTIPTYIECKANFGAVYLGNPDNQDDTAGWHTHQRNWWRNVACKVRYPYYILLWVYPERTPDRVLQKDSYLYLVPPTAWLEMEARIYPRKTVALLPELERESKYKDFAVANMWQEHRTTWSTVIETIRRSSHESTPVVV